MLVESQLTQLSISKKKTDRLSVEDDPPAMVKKIVNKRVIFESGQIKAPINKKIRSEYLEDKPTIIEGFGGVTL